MGSKSHLVLGIFFRLDVISTFTIPYIYAKHATRISPKILCCAWYFELSSRRLDILKKHCLSFDILLPKLHVLERKQCTHEKTSHQKYSAARRISNSPLSVWKCDEIWYLVFDTLLFKRPLTAHSLTSLYIERSTTMFIMNILFT